MSEKAFRIAAVVLLVVIALTQLASVLYDPAAACQKQVAHAVALSKSSWGRLYSDYRADAYGNRAENINQQIFISGEYQVAGFQALLQQNQLILQLLTACK